MHPTALNSCQHFFNAYGSAFEGEGAKVIELGSQDVNGSLRACCPSRFRYCGVDFVAGNGVDVLLTDPYKLPFDDGSVDIVITSSCFEHSEMFWVLFLEVMRILKPRGLLYLNVPSNGAFHRWPVDCWRFYPDSGHALVAWAQHNGMQPAVLESYIGEQGVDIWNDFVAIFVKDVAQAFRYTTRILTGREDLSNGKLFSGQGFVNYRLMPEDNRKLDAIHRIVNGELSLPDDKAKLELIGKIINNEIKVR
jgi:SAM-dependent methyltransferase